MLIDFGKATGELKGKMYSFTPTEKEQYRQKFPHIAPEVIEGDSKESTYSDMFAVGGILYKIADQGCLLANIEIQEKLLFLAGKCRIVQYRERFSAKTALSYIQQCIDIN